MMKYGRRAVRAGQEEPRPRPALTSYYSLNKLLNMIIRNKILLSDY